MSAFVRVCGPPNSAYLVGYPGISATLVSEENPELNERFRSSAARETLIEGYADM